MAMSCTCRMQKIKRQKDKLRKSCVTHGIAVLEENSVGISGFIHGQVKGVTAIQIGRLKENFLDKGTFIIDYNLGGPIGKCVVFHTNKLILGFKFLKATLRFTILLLFYLKLLSGIPFH